MLCLKLLFCIFIINVSFVNSGFPKSTKLTNDFVTLDYYDKNYFSDFKILNTKVNRTFRTVSASGNLLKEINADYYFQIIAYEFRSNRYQRYAPAALKLNVCDMLSKSIYNVKNVIEKYSNIPARCPVHKGHYTVSNATPTMDNVPPLFPEGQYKTCCILYHFKRNITQWSWYGRIENIY